MWTALWQELSDVSATLVGCDHVFGLLMRRGWPLAPLCLSRIGSQSIALGAVHSIGEKWPNLFPLRGESVFSRISL